MVFLLLSYLAITIGEPHMMVVCLYWFIDLNTAAYVTWVYDCVHARIAWCWCFMVICVCGALPQILQFDVIHDNKQLSKTLYLFVYTLTWPKTSSFTVNVRSRMSVMSLSFIHCKDWWNSSSRYSKSERSVGLWDPKLTGIIHNNFHCKSTYDWICSQPEEGLVERSGEESIKEVLMNQSQTQYAPAETEPGRWTETFTSAKWNVCWVDVAYMNQLTIPDGSQQRPTWGWFEQCKCHWPSIQKGHSMD